MQPPLETIGQVIQWASNAQMDLLHAYTQQWGFAAKADIWENYIALINAELPLEKILFTNISTKTKATKIDVRPYNLNLFSAACRFFNLCSLVIFLSIFFHSSLSYVI